MKNIKELVLPEDCNYTNEHIWIRADGDTYLVGISDYAQDQLGEIAFVDLPQEGDTVDAGSDFGTVESLKSVNLLYMPVSGEVCAVNTTLEDIPTLINVSCYDKGWIIRIRPDNEEDVQKLFNSSSYKEFLNN